MLTSLLSIATLMLSTLMMMIGFGLMNYMVPIRSIAEGWSTMTISLIATSYTFGFTLSCIVTPKLVLRVGHVRVFGALTTLLTLAILMCALVVDWRAWLVFRWFAGFAMAGSYLIIESWLNERVNNANRGALFSVYMITSLTGSIAGQYLVPLGDPSGSDLFILCAVIFSLALFPTALSTAQSPTPIAQARFDVWKLYRRSPVAFIGSLLSGAACGTWIALGGVYSQNVGMTTAEGATLLAAVLAGGAIAQMPIGKISDMVDRRLVMIVCGIVGVISCGIMAMFDASNLTALYIAGFFVGTVIYPTYAINVAHANDLAEPQEYVTISSAIMVLYGLGTITGPIIGGALMQQTGAGGLPWFLAANFAAYALYAGWRITRRAPDDSGKSDFQSMPIPLQGNDPARTPNTSLNEIEAHPIL